MLWLNTDIEPMTVCDNPLIGLIAFITVGILMIDFQLLLKKLTTKRISKVS